LYNINNSEDYINRGFEFLLDGGRKQTKPFQIIFKKIVCFLNREVSISFELSLRKKEKTNLLENNHVSS